MAILSKACKPDDFESHNSLKLSFTNIPGILIVNLSLNQPLLTFLLYLRQNLDGSIDSDNFFVRGYLSLIRKDSSTHGWSRSLCEGKTSFCTGLISRKLCRFLLMFSTGFTSLSVLLLFPLSIIFVFVRSFLFYFI